MLIISDNRFGNSIDTLLGHRYWFGKVMNQTMTTYFEVRTAHLNLITGWGDQPGIYVTCESAFWLREDLHCPKLTGGLFLYSGDRLSPISKDKFDMLNSLAIANEK